MNITIVTIGTRGDVQPYIALAGGLKSAGHRVTICTHQTFQDWVVGHGIGYAPLTGDIRALLASPEGTSVFAQRNPARLMRQMTQLVAPILREMTADIIAATRDAELILGSTLAYFLALTAAQVHRRPLFLASLQWLSPTGTLPAMALPLWPEGRPGASIYNRLSFRVVNRALYMLGGKPLNTARQELTGLPPLPFAAMFDDLRRQRIPTIYGLSRWALPQITDWNTNVHLTGFWFLDDSDWTPSEPLVDFLAAGPAPVYAGFGSMSDRDPAAAGRMVLSALAYNDQRGVIAAGWGGLRPTTDRIDIFTLTEAPHEWLFPRMAAVIHHGGVGTTSRALAAGVPQVVVPFISDQNFWGEQMRRLGVAAAPIPRARLTVDNLTAALDAAIEDPRLKERASSLGTSFRAEDGVANAVRAIEGMVARGATGALGIRSG